ncbi:winged helix-turn-helix domain-containing protein [Pseudonocardia nigra]|uniref:winged helix-turn-helix domain-containing protein n=1 Tax=Pseudonocardia nigra TaxID=1921578 RepID=UPI001C603599|nr:winged helix-turn-helix domain-containing protein [Pseudonocardia nigra]
MFAKVAPAWPPVLRYPARGTAALWSPPVAVADGLAGVLGRSRARLLAELESPASTTELARRIALAAGGVSEHLARLRAAGLVTAHRSGPVVLYARTALAGDLVAASGDASG